MAGWGKLEAGLMGKQNAYNASSEPFLVLIFFSPLGKKENGWTEPENILGWFIVLLGWGFFPLWSIIRQWNVHPKKVQNHTDWNSLWWISMLSAWTQSLQSRIHMKLYTPGDLATLQRPGSASAHPVPPESLTLKNRETLQSSFSNFSVPIIFAKFFLSSSSIYLPSGKVVI